MDNLKVIQRVISEIRYKVEHEVNISGLDRENYIAIIEALEGNKDLAMQLEEYKRKWNSYSEVRKREMELGHLMGDE